MFEEREICFENEKWETENDISSDMIYDEISYLQEISWQDESFQMKNFFTETYLLKGYFQGWRGIKAGGFTFNTFDEMSKAWSGNYKKKVKFYDNL